MKIDEGIYLAVHKAWGSGYSVKSNFAREYADAVAAASYLGYLSTMAPDGQFTHVWRVTQAGLQYLIEKA